MCCFPIEPASRHPRRRVPFICFMGGTLDSQEMQYFLLQSIGELAIDLRDYETEMSQCFTKAWKLAQCEVEKAQKLQKEYYDQGTVTDKVHVGDRVFIYTPSEKKGKAYKFACPFVGPYRVLEVYDNEAKLQHISKPNSQPIRVALN